MILLSAALAAPPPGVDLEDVGGWEAHAFALTEGPAGPCWLLSGTLTMRLALYQPATLFSAGGQEEQAGQGTFTGRIVGGQWVSLSYELLDGQTPMTGFYPIIPLVGRIDPALPVNRNLAASEDDKHSISFSIGEDADSGASDAVNLLHGAIEEWWTTPVSTAFVRWDEPTRAAELVVDVPIDQGRGGSTVQATARFPGGGPYATAIDAQLPRRMTFGDWPVRLKVMDGQLHLRGVVVDGALLPSQESWSTLLGLMGFTIGYEQQLRYTEATPCAPPP